MKKIKDILFIILAVLAVGLWDTVLILRSGNAEKCQNSLEIVKQYAESVDYCTKQD